MSDQTEHHQPAQNLEELDILLAWHHGECVKKAENFGGIHEGWCSFQWDGIMCWPPSASGTHHIPCPTYLAGFNSEFNASKLCSPDGRWNNWTDFSRCGGQTVDILVDLDFSANPFLESYVPLVSSLSEMGYGISGITLVVAFIILISFKRLRCPRNMLHLHLFVSFIMKASVVFLKRSIFEQGLGPLSDFTVKNGTGYFHEKDAGNWECKTLTTIWQYFIAANYSWLLMEGLYIHNVIMWALSADTSRISVYIVLGWGLPLIIVPGWAISRVFWDNELCWTLSEVAGIRYIIQIPTIASIIINFALFLNIFRLLMGKVRATIQEEAERYWRLAKSTLVLVFLFGVPYFIFLGLYDFRGEQNATTHPYVTFAYLLCNQLFASFQGFIVALIYCFLNGEVQDEIRKAWRELSRNDNRRAENAFPSTSCASWSSAHSTVRRRPDCCQVSRFLSFFPVCSSRPESRTSKRTETVDCIVCEACISCDVKYTKRNSLLSEVCHHVRNDELPEVETKLINSSVSSPV